VERLAGPLPPPLMPQSPPLPPEWPPPALEREPGAPPSDRHPWSLEPRASAGRPRAPVNDSWEASRLRATDATSRSPRRGPPVPPPPPPRPSQATGRSWIPHPTSYMDVRTPTAPASQAARSAHRDFPAMALASFRAQYQQAQDAASAQSAGSWLPSFYVEVVQSSGYGQCCGCGETFVVGQLILGFELQFDGWQRWQRWVHAPRCIRQVHMEIPRSRHTTVSFNPHTPPWERSRIVEELLSIPTSHRMHHQVQQWHYEGALPQAHIQLIRPAEPVPVEAERFSIERPGQASSAAGFYDARSAMSRAAVYSGWVPVTAVPMTPLEPNIVGRFIPRTPSALLAPRTPTGPSLESLLEFVPVQRLSKREAEPCVVCQEPMLPKESVRRLPCFHVFHVACIDRWLAVKATCPLDNMCLQDMLEKQRSIDRAAPE
jgi:hypothetical protein